MSLYSNKTPICSYKARSKELNRGLSHGNQGLNYSILHLLLPCTWVGTWNQSRTHWCGMSTSQTSPLIHFDKHTPVYWNSFHWLVFKSFFFVYYFPQYGFTGIGGHPHSPPPSLLSPPLTHSILSQYYSPSGQVTSLIF